MADLIQLLPDSIANQIAAGEVIQRPASVVKELLENAIDAGGSAIKVIIKDAGKGLIQVIDDGCGMSETDARMSFERHATSKIRQAKDLFAIRTMGFRGEALASIAAVAQVEMRSRQRTEELGTRILIEGSKVKAQEPCQCAAGTKISVKNLFYNVPARRNFLKTNASEMRHIMDEFQRIAIANPEIFFSLHHNDSEIYHLQAGSLRQRVVGALGQHTNKKLVPVKEETDILQLNGFVGKPEFAKKTRGEQILFVNQRFIKSGFLNHAIVAAYEDLLPKDTYPLYVIFIEIDPARIDINVHPTKQEIKFDDERLVYNYLKVSVRHALGRHSITPSLDFEQEMSFPAFQPSRPQTDVQPQVGTSQTSQGIEKGEIPSFQKDANLKNWENLYKGLEDFDKKEEKEEPSREEPVTIESRLSGQGQNEGTGYRRKVSFQIHGAYIISQIKSGFLLIDQQAAHERILFDQYLGMLREKQVSSQRQLFSKKVDVSPSDAMLIKTILPQLNLLGFDIQEFGKNTFVIHGLPADLGTSVNEQKIIEELLERYKNNAELQTGQQEKIAWALASSAAIKRGRRLEPEEMLELIDKLFACEMPYKSPSGRNCFVTFDLEELEKKFM